MPLWALPLLALVAAPGPELTVELQPGPTFLATWVGPAGTGAGGEFQGTLSCFESPHAMPFAGPADLDGERLRVSARLRYADVPSDWPGLWKLGSGCALRGRLAGADAIDWFSPVTWRCVPAAKESGGQLVSLVSLQLILLSDRAADVRAVFSVVNPFSFPLEVLAAAGSVRVRGQEVGGASAKTRTLRPRRKARFEVKVRADPRLFRAAAGDRWDAGGELSAEVEAALTLKLPGGNQALSFVLPGVMGTDGARSGVFSLPEGASSLSPR